MNGWKCECGSFNGPGWVVCRICGADKPLSSPTPSPDVPESVGQVQEVTVAQAFAMAGCGVPAGAKLVYMGVGRSHIETWRWQLGDESAQWYYGEGWVRQPVYIGSNPDLTLLPASAAMGALPGNVSAMLAERTKGHAPTQLPAASTWEIFTDASYRRCLEEEGYDSAGDDGRVGFRAGWTAAQRTVRQYFLERDSPSPAAPSTTATGQSLSVPPATEGTAEAVREIMRDAFNYADSLEGATPAYISSKFRYIAENLQRLAKRLEGNAAAVPVEELEVLCADFTNLADANTPDVAYAYSHCDRMLNELIQKAKAGEQ